MAALLFILIFSFCTFAQEKQPTEEKKTLKLEANPSKIHLSILTINNTSGPIKKIELTYENLPEEIIITNPNDKAGAKEVKFTRQQIWRFLQYFNALTEHIERAWAEDK